MSCAPAAAPSARGGCGLFAVVVLFLAGLAEALRLQHLEAGRERAVLVQLEDAREPVGRRGVSVLEQAQILKVPIAAGDQPRGRVGVLVEPELGPIELPRRSAHHHHHAVRQPGQRSGRGQVRAGGEIQLTDGLAVLAQQKRLLGVRFTGTRHDAGDRLGYLQANIAYALKRADLRDGLLAFLREVVK